MTSEHPAILSIRSLKREFLEHLPIWFVYLSAVGLLHAALANFPDKGFLQIGIQKIYFVPTLLFPMVWFVGYFILRIRHSQRIQQRWKAYLWLFFMAVLVPLFIIFFYQRYELTHEQLALLFEASQFFWVFLFIVQIALTRGWHSLVLFFGVTFIYGLLLENSGIIMRFFYEPSFKLYLGRLPAPLCTMLGWSLVFYLTIAVTERLAEWLPSLKEGIWRRAWVATLLALSLDAQLDPLASMSGVFWRWNEALPHAFLGVPIINFTAWFGAFLPYAYFVFKFKDREDLSPSQRNWELFLRVPLSVVLAGLICFGLMMLIEGGFDGPSFQILKAFGEKLVPY